MTAQTLVPLIAQGLIPVAWISWIAFASHRSRSGWAAHVMGAAAYLLAVALVGLWLILPWNLIWLWAALPPR